MNARGEDLPLPTNEIERLSVEYSYPEYAVKSDFLYTHYTISPCFCFKKEIF